MTSPDDPREWARLHAPLLPVRGRRTAIVLGVGQGVLFATLAVLLPSAGSLGFRWNDRVELLALSAAIGVLLWRFARLAALPGEQTLVVRNVIYERTLDWAQIVTVRFGGGQPWVILDLADGETLAVMAIQRADGEGGQAQARRLATLVELHSRTDRND